MQNYERMYSYIHDYQKLVYEYFSKHGVAFLTTYYNLNKNTSIWEDKDLLGGSYERVGELSGTKWDKYLTLPVYFIEEMSTSFDGQEIGYIKDGVTSFVIPSSYGIQPYPGDIIKFESSFLMPNNNNKPLYIVSGIDKSVNTEITFWKVKVTTFQSKKLEEIDLQVDNTYMFYEYDKNIHTLDDAVFLTNLLVKHKEIKNKLDKKWNSNSGLYFPF